MKKYFTFLLLLLSSCVAVNRQPNTDVMYGTRSSWKGSQEAIGMQFNYAGDNGVGPEMSMVVSKEEQTHAHNVETSVGLRKSLIIEDIFQGYFSTGLSIQNPSNDYNSDAAVYGQVGVNWFLDRHYSAGVMFRRTFWDDAELTFVMFGLGYSF